MRSTTSALLLALLGTALTHSLQNCRTERRPCDVRCARMEERYMTNMNLSQPRICHVTKPERAPCKRETVKSEELVLTTCQRTRTEWVPCKGCSEEIVLTKSCNGTCECEAGEEQVYGGCRSCGGKFEKVVTDRGYRLVLPFSDDKPAVRNLRCFAGFFEEMECDGVSEVCSMNTRSFNSVFCGLKVCWQCRRIRLFDVSRELERYCRYLLKEVCGRLGTGRIGGMKMLGGMKAEKMEMTGTVREVEEEMCDDGCVRKVVGCGRRKMVCKGVGDMCRVSFPERYECTEKRVGDVGMRRVSCGTEMVEGAATVVVGRECRRLFCSKTICD